MALVKSSDKVVYYRIDSMTVEGVSKKLSRAVRGGLDLTVKSTNERKRRARETAFLCILR